MPNETSAETIHTRRQRPKARASARRRRPASLVRLRAWFVPIPVGVLLCEAELGVEVQGGGVVLHHGQVRGGRAVGRRRPVKQGGAQAAGQTLVADVHVDNDVEEADVQTL